MNRIFSDHLGGNNINLKINKAYLIFNPTLATNFSNKKGIMENLYKSNTPIEENWKEKDNLELRTRLIQEFHRKIDLYEWNNNQNIPILVGLHGTEEMVAWKICGSGFATLSSLDAGWYGVGLYFTTSTDYALTYCAIKLDPCILVTLVIPGNAYPVTESKAGPNSLLGKPLTRGYHSHYVHTSRNGEVLEKFNENFHDELVVNQESQVLPIFLLVLDNIINLST